MGMRIKIGPFLSWGATGFRLHLPFGGGNSVSTGRSGTRGFFRLGPLYYNWRKR